MLLKLTKNSPVTGYLALIILCFIFFAKKSFYDNGFLFIPEDAATAGLILLCSISLTITIKKQALSKNYILSGLLLTILCFSDPVFEDMWIALKMLVAIVTFFCLLRSFDKTSGYVSLFNGAFLLSCISVFDSVFIFTLPFVWITLIVYNNNYRNWIISLIAIVLPHAIYFCFYFLYGGLQMANTAINTIFDMPAAAFPNWDNLFILPTTELFIAIIAFIYQIKNLRGDIIYRTKTILFLVGFVYFSLFTVLFYTLPTAHTVLPLIASFLIAKYFHRIKRTWIAEIIIWMMIVGVMVC
jgi:hypothetical protein